MLEAAGYSLTQDELVEEKRTSIYDRHFKEMTLRIRDFPLFNERA